MIDVPAYLARIGVPALQPAPNAETLRTIHRAHVASVPFENLDILLGKPIRLDLPSLEEKLVRSRRGGYCFEQNSLLQAALLEIGFDVVPLAARVRLGGRTSGPRTHMLLGVRADGRDYLADVGFGSGGPLEPLPLEPGPAQSQSGWNYRIVAEGNQHLLETTMGGRWTSLYGFTFEPQLASDYEVANYYTSTHPESPFTKMVVAQRQGPETRVILRGDLLTETKPDGTSSESKIEGDDALLRILDERFGLRFPAGTRFRPPDRSRSSAVHPNAG